MVLSQLMFCERYKMPIIQFKEKNSKDYFHIYSTSGKYGPSIKYCLYFSNQCPISTTFTLNEKIQLYIFFLFCSHIQLHSPRNFLTSFPLLLGSFQFPIDEV